MTSSHIFDSIALVEINHQPFRAGCVGPPIDTDEFRRKSTSKGSRISKEKWVEPLPSLNESLFFQGAFLFSFWGGGGESQFMLDPDLWIGGSF